jgi:hypothetical protein
VQVIVYWELEYIAGVGNEPDGAPENPIQPYVTVGAEHVQDRAFEDFQ